MNSIIPFFLALIFVCFQTSFAQNIPLGTWRTHLAYQPARGIALAGDLVYCFSDNGLFYCDKTDNSLTTLSKIDGLSETIVRVMGYENTNQTLVLGFDNANINLLKDNEIKEINLIKNATISTSKNLNQVYFYQNFAYISADFGVVVLDLKKQEIKETYQNLGINGSNLAIYGATISRDSLVLATAQGVMIGALKDNLLDFNSWKRFNLSNGLPPQNTLRVVSRNNQVYAIQNNVGLFKYTHQNQWQNIALPVNVFNNLNISQNRVIVSALGRGLTLDENDNLSQLNSNLKINPQEILYDTSNKIWLADRQLGLVQNFTSDIATISTPFGPARSETWKLYQAQNQILASSGGFDINYNPLNRNAGFYQFKEAQWTNFNSFEPFIFQIIIPNIRDILTSVYNPIDKNYYFASFGDGILVRKSDNTFEVINQNTANTTLKLDASNKLKISGLAVDKSGDLWIANQPNAGQASLHVRRANNTWQSYLPFNIAARTPLDILIDNSSFKWIRLSPNRGGGIWVMDDKTNRNRYLSTDSNEGNLPHINVNALIQDLDGQIWVGTDKGITVFTNPVRVFEGSVNAFTPIFESRPLLRAEQITAIAIDGGNRKWIGTKSGVWLFSADGSQLINYFNEKNSPLLSDNILDIKIIPNSGEVFIATDKGIISYRGTASEGNNVYQNVQVFPNPVRPDFTGLVGISGLVEGANVKITDVSGRLFYETKAQGGTATWNLRDYNNVKAQTGIYLIFMTNFDGSQTLVSKIAVVE